jgi:hypothetical protein
MLGTIPLMVMNLANRLIPYPIAPDWIQAGAWSLKVRGDLLQSGKLGAQKVPFGEFLRTRLEVYGDVLTIDEVSRRLKGGPGKRGASVVVMPVGVPYSSGAVS